MPYYIDSSAFLKLVVEEPHSAAMREWASDVDLLSADLLATEVLRAARRHSSRVLTAAQERLDVVTMFALEREAFRRAAALDPAGLRSLDALHLAAALSLGDELDGLVAYDERLIEAAALHGVSTVMPT